MSRRWDDSGKILQKVLRKGTMKYTAKKYCEKVQQKSATEK